MTYAPEIELYPPGHVFGHPLRWMWTINELEQSGTAPTGDEAVEAMWVAWQKGEDAHHARIQEQDRRWE